MSSIEQREGILTVNKGILKLWSSPNTTLILLGVFVCLSIAVLAEGRPEI